MKVPTPVWILGSLVLLVACVVISITQLSTDASAAAAFCSRAQRQGVPCEVGPRYDAQVVVVTDATGSQQGLLVISEGTKTLGVIPLE